MKAFLFLSVLALSSVGFSSEQPFDDAKVLARAEEILKLTDEPIIGEICHGLIRGDLSEQNKAEAKRLVPILIGMRDEEVATFGTIPVDRFGTAPGGKDQPVVVRTMASQVIAGQTAQLLINPAASEVGDHKIDSFRQFRESDCPSY